MGRRIPESKRREVMRLAAKGLRRREIAEQLRLGETSVQRIKRRCGGVYVAGQWGRSSSRLSLSERVTIEAQLGAKKSFTAIAAMLGRPVSTVSREVGGVGGRDAYRALAADEAAFERARRPKQTKLDANPRLCKEVIAGLEKLWSPEQIAGRLTIDHPDDPTMRVSHEVIYQSLFVQGRGELNRELTRYLRSGRAVRKTRAAASSTAGKIVDPVSIRDRPAEANDRSVPGHWEGDLVLGAKGDKAAVGTIVERSVGYTLLVHLPDDHTAPTVGAAVAAETRRLPDGLWRSLAWDQGKEMAHHVQFTVDTGIQIYFCDPHSPWQRPSNENTNGLLRQYLPKGRSLAGITRDDLDQIADSLNGRPRKRLGWMTPSEKLTELLATTP